MLKTKLEHFLRKTWSRISPPEEKNDEKVPLSKLLAQMDAYGWGSVEDTPVNEDERRERLRYFNELIDASGVEMNGSLLDLASGTTSLAYLYPDTVAIDNDPRKIKMLRRDGIKALIADIESLPFENDSFDYVVSISPPQKPVILHSDGCIRFHVNQECNRKLVDATLRIARKNVLIASHAVAREPPYEHLIEKRGTNGHYYVLYRASNDSV